MCLGICFYFKWLDDFWFKEILFILLDFYLILKVFNCDYGSNLSFYFVSMLRKLEIGKYMVFGFGVGVGLFFLCLVLVKGIYDEELKENKDVS